MLKVSLDPMPKQLLLYFRNSLLNLFNYLVPSLYRTYSPNESILVNVINSFPFFLTTTTPSNIIKYEKAFSPSTIIFDNV